MEEICLIIENTTYTRNQEKEDSFLNKYRKRNVSLYQIKEDLRKAEEYRLAQLSSQSQKSRQKVQKAIQTATCMREELEHTREKKKKLLETMIRDAETRRNQYLELSRQNAKIHSEKVKMIANAQVIAKRQDLLRQFTQSRSQLWSAESRRSRMLALRARKACLSPVKENQCCEGNFSHLQILETEHEAASVIQFFWRLHFIEKAFSKLRLSWELCVEEGFEATKGKILKEEALKAAASAVRMFSPHSTNLPEAEVKKLARLFLTSFVISAHPQHVLEHPEHGLEKSVVISAQNLLQFLMDPRHHFISSAIKARSIWVKYKIQYEEWERSDRERLIDGIIKDYVELETMRLKVRAGVNTKKISNHRSRWSPNVAPWKMKQPQLISAIWIPQIGKRQLRLKNALVKVGGSKAIEELERNLEITQELFLKEKMPVEDSTAYGSEQNLSNIATASKEEYDFAKFGLNEVFAHEIMIDIEQFISDILTPDGFTQMLRIAGLAFRDKLEEELSVDSEEEVCFETFLSVLEETRQRLRAVLPQKSYLPTDTCKSRLENAIDIDLIRNQIGHFSFAAHDARSLLELYTETLYNVQAPYQDEDLFEWKKLWMNELSELDNRDCTSKEYKKQLLVIVGRRLCDVMDRVDFLTRDIVLSKIHLLDTILKSYGCQWEDIHFSEKIDEGKLDRDMKETKAWLSASLKRICQAYSTFDYSQIAIGDIEVTKRFLRASFIYLMELSTDDKKGMKPEVLLLDEKRLEYLRQQVHVVTIRASLDIILDRFLKQNGSTEHSVEKRKLSELCSSIANDLSSSQLSVEERSHDVVRKTLEQYLPETLLAVNDREFLTSLLRRVIKTEEPISCLLRKRALDYLYRSFLFSASISTCPVMQLQPLGLGSAADSIQKVVETVNRVTEHMLAVHFHRLKPISEETAASWFGS